MFSTPRSTPAQRQRANSRTKYHIAFGPFVEPKTCSKCGTEKAKLDPHHPDYNKQLEVVFLCRSCHIRAHHYPNFLDGVPVVTIPPANRPHYGRFKKGLVPPMPAWARRKASANTSYEDRIKAGVAAARARWGENFKPQRFYLNTKNEFQWEIIDLNTGKVVESISKSADDYQFTRKRVAMHNARERRRMVEPEITNAAERMPALKRKDTKR